MEDVGVEQVPWVDRKLVRDPGESPHREQGIPQVRHVRVGKYLLAQQDCCRTAKQHEGTQPRTRRRRFDVQRASTIASNWVSHSDVHKSKYGMHRHEKRQTERI